MPAVGDEAPRFVLPADDGTIVELGALRGRPVVLFFYPRDDTKTCTIEACAFRDAMPRFEDLDAIVLGISPDSVKSHAKFRAKHALPYRLLSDEEHQVAEQYGVWQEKTLFALRYLGVVRTTFVVDAAGRIARIFERVKVDGHVQEVAAAVRTLVP
jgi:thioredoxin-dependent peroxiredoxin